MFFLSEKNVSLNNNFEKTLQEGTRQNPITSKRKFRNSPPKGVVRAPQTKRLGLKYFI